MSCYHHLTIEERESLMLFLSEGVSLGEIGRRLKRSPSTISRELKRNPGAYRASVAEQRYKERRRNSVRKQVLADIELNKQVRFCLGHLYWSPEQIAERFRKEGTARVSTSTIYRALESGLLRDTLRYYLRIKYKKLGKNKEPKKKCFQKTIELRPIEADNRSEIGHWEGDTVLGYKERSVLLTLVDRRSRYLVSKKIPNKESSTTREAIEELLRQSQLPIKTITFDQGTEFAEGAQMEQELKTDVYFAHPGSPWERPTNENTNGLLRQFVPKRHSISALTDDDIQRIVAKLNFRPRKCLGWKTPYEVAFNQVLHLT